VKDWKAIARASVELPAADLERAIAPLEALEETFRPLVEQLPPELEPAAVFRMDEDER